MGDELTVTVIATGFEQGESMLRFPSANQPTLVVEPIKAPALVSVAVDNGGGKKADDLDRPTYLRQQEATRTVPGNGNLLVDDDWDVPTFLRKRADG